jgi:hypothetical protein
VPSFCEMRLKLLSIKCEFWPFWQLPDPSLIGLHGLIISLHDLNNALIVSTGRSISPDRSGARRGLRVQTNTQCGAYFENSWHLRLALRVRPTQAHNTPDQARQIARLRQQQPGHQHQQRQKQRLPAQAHSISGTKVIAFKHQLRLHMVLAANEFRGLK